MNSNSNDFVDWIATNPEKKFGIMITPWGEAIIHGYYRRAMNRLSHLPNVDRIAIQTNLSCKLGDFEAANKQSLATLGNLSSFSSFTFALRGTLPRFRSDENSI